MPYIDLAWELRTNPQFSNKITRLQEEFKRRALSKSAKEREGKFEVLRDIFRECKYNASLLVPWFFPTFNRGRPLRVGQRPATYALFLFCPGGWVAVRGARQFGKSTSIGSRQLILPRLIPGWNAAYICPHNEHRETYANKLRDLETSGNFPKVDGKFKNNMYYKEFPVAGGIGHLYLLRVLTSVAPTRGKTTDENVFDEYQLFNPDFEPELEPMQTNSDCPIRIYSGTSTWIDSPLEARYQGSSQGTWYIRTHRDGKYIDCGDPEQVMSMMGPERPICPFTKWPLDVTDGFFVHKSPSLLAENRIGIHVPQIIIPEFANEFKYYAKILIASKSTDQNKFIQEYLGIPCESGQREITELRLQQLCTLTDSPEDRRAKAEKGYYKYVVSGCDWGGSEYDPVFRIKTSFTVHAMMGLAPDNGWDVIHMKRYPGMSYMQVASDIIKNHKYYKGFALGSDSGGGMAYNSFLRSSGDIPVERHMIFQYGGLPNTPMLAPVKSQNAINLFLLNRGESLSSLFSDLNRDPFAIRFPAWSESREYLMDMLNVMRVIAETRGGVSWFQHHRNPTKADDFLHAINYCRVVAKVILGEPMFQDASMSHLIRDLVRGGSTQPLYQTTDKTLGEGMISWG